MYTFEGIIKCYVKGSFFIMLKSITRVLTTAPLSFCFILYIQLALMKILKQNTAM